MAFGETLKRIMREKGVSREDLAEKLNVKPPMISQWCSGAKENPRTDTVKRIADALGVTPSALFEEAPAYPALKDGVVRIPIFDNEAGMGGEICNGLDRFDSYLTVREETVRAELGVGPSHLRIIRVRGDSMEPSIHPGELIIVNCEEG